MKAQLNSWPAWLKVLVYFLLLWLATFIGGVVPALNDFIFFFSVSLLISWVFLHAEARSVRSLGFVPRSKKDYQEFFTGVSIGGIMLISTVVITLLLTRDHWRFNPNIDPIYVVIAFFTCLWSAFIQEFVFRGYPFQTLLKHYSPLIAQFFIAIPFGLMHINHSMNLMEMASVMLTTGLGSILFGLAYRKTGKLFLPIGLHLGWNYAQQLIPRTAGGGNSGLIAVSTGHINYAHWMVIGPYLLIVTLVITWFAIVMRARRNCNGFINQKSELIYPIGNPMQLPPK